MSHFKAIATVGRAGTVFWHVNCFIRQWKAAPQGAGRINMKEDKVMNLLVKNGGNSASFDLTFPSAEKLARAFFDRLPDFGLFSGREMESRLDVQVNDDTVEVKMACPGCKGSDFDIEVVGDFLTVRVEHSESEEKHEDARCIFSERSIASYEESVKLPVPVNGGDTSAEYVDGVLQLSIPRRKAEKPEKHVVKVG